MQDLLFIPGVFLSRNSIMHGVGVAVLIALVGYLGSIVTLIYSSLFSNEIKTINYHLDKVTCVSKVCTRYYSFEMGASQIGKSLVVGSVVNPTVWFCDGANRYTSDDPKSVVSSRLTLNEYFVLQAPYVEGCPSGKWSMQVTHPESQKKVGFRSKNFILAPSHVALKLKAANEFVLRDYKILNFSAMAAILVLSFLMRIVSVDTEGVTRFRISALLFLGAFAQAGLLEVFIPFSSMILVDRWMGMLSYCTYMMLCLSYFRKGPIVEKAQATLIVMFAVTLILTGDRITTWIWYSFFCATVYLLIALKYKDIKVCVAGVLALLASAEMVGVPGMPSSFIIATYIASIIVLENQKSLISFFKINRLMRLSSKKRLQASHSDRQIAANGIIKLFQRQFRIGSITVLNISDKEVLHLSQYFSGRLQPVSTRLSELPPVFAHVITTGNSLDNVHVDSKLISSIRREMPKHTKDSDYFTIVPLMAGREVVGALALTDYSQGMISTSLNNSTFQFCLDILKTLLIENLLSSPKSESLAKSADLSAKLGSLNGKTFDSPEDVLISFGEVISNTFGWRVASSMIVNDENLLKVLKCHLFDKEIETQVMNGKIYAHKDNQQGPIALAVNEKKVVIVANTKWLEGVVHANTIKFFNTHKTKTAAFVPVIDDSSNKVIGVYWLEGVKESEISYSDKTMLGSFARSASEQIALMQSQNKLNSSKESLTHFVPKHLIDDYMSGKQVTEDDYGFLMIFDIKGSTRLAHQIGNQEFHQSVGLLKEKLSFTLNQNGWVLQQFVWDGFEFTLSADENSLTLLDIDKCCEVIQPLFENWKSGLISQFGDRSEIVSLAYRVCFTFGDTSRGIVEEGATRKWALTGNAIAVASKVEQASKALGGVIFCDNSMLKRSTGSWCLKANTAHGLSVYEYVSSNELKKAA